MYAIKRISENPYTALTRWECSRDLTAAILAYHGDQWKDKVRSGRIVKSGRLRFSTGCGYDIISDDLLGGEADGRAARRFYEDHDYIRRYDALDRADRRAF